MNRSLVSRFFIVSLIGLAVSLVLFIVAAALAIGRDVFVMDGPDVVAIKPGVFGWAMAGLVVVALLGVFAAVAGQVVAWVGAAVNTATLPDKTWFVVILVGGLVGLGTLVTLAYVIGGPESERPSARAVLPPLPPMTTGVSPGVDGQRDPDLVHHR